MKYLKIIVLEMLIFITGFIITIYVLSALQQKQVIQKKDNIAVILPTVALSPTKPILTLSANQTLINRLNQIKTTMNGMQISGINVTKPSPDNKYMLILAYAGISPSILYVSDINMIDIKWLGIALSAGWSPSGKYILYAYTHADAGPSDIAIYDVNLKKEITIKKEYSTNGCLFHYTDPQWLPGESGIKVSASVSIQDCPNETSGPKEATLHFADQSLQ
jgi:hypothetical protein